MSKKTAPFQLLNSSDSLSYQFVYGFYKKKIEKRQNFPPTLKPQIMFEKRKQEAGIKKQCSVVIIG